MKRARQAEILKIIQSVDVETQEQLLDELKRRGFASTQATIPGTSRSCVWSRRWLEAATGMWSPSVREWWIPMFACAISSKRAWYR